MKTLLILTLMALIVALGACAEPDRPTVPLYLAIQRGDLDQLERHIHWGTDINVALPGGRYPLHSAAEKGRFVMAKTLLSNGADIGALTEQGDSALDLAILSGRTQVAELLLDSGARLDASTLLIKAASLGVTDRDTVKFLVEAGADGLLFLPEVMLCAHAINRGAQLLEPLLRVRHQADEVRHGHPPRVILALSTLRPARSLRDTSLRLTED